MQATIIEIISNHGEAIITALISIIISVISTWQFKKYIEVHRGFYNIAKDRMAAVQGHWSGNFIQEDSPEGDARLDLTLDGELKFDKGKISGMFSYEYKNKQTTIIVQGHAMDNNYIILNYRDKEKTTVRYGTFLIELSPLVNSLTGKFIAYAAEKYDIVSGDLALIKSIISQQSLDNVA